MLRAVLFDLDGTLLPMDMDIFTKGYFTLLAKTVAAAGYESGKLVETIWKGTGAMVSNDGTMTNESRFWRAFAEAYGERALADKAIFDSFYENEFRGAVAYTQPQAHPELARKALDAARRQAEKVILATNPIFPRTAVEARLDWIGLKAADFDDVTTYENSTFCKPEPRYYTELLSRAGVSPNEALMVGNDVQEDINAAGSTGIACYLVRDCMINRSGEDTACASGSLSELVSFLEAVEM